MRSDSFHVGSVLCLLLVLHGSHGPKKLVLLLECDTHLCLLLLVLLMLFMKGLGIAGKGPVHLPGLLFKLLTVLFDQDLACFLCCFLDSIQSHYPGSVVVHALEGGVGW